MGKEEHTETDASKATTTSKVDVADTSSKPASAAETKMGGDVEKKQQIEGGSGKGNKDKEVKTEELAKLTYGVQSFGQ